MATVISFYSIAKDQRLNRKSILLYTVFAFLIGLMATIIFPDYYWWILAIVLLFGGFMIYKSYSISKKEEQEVNTLDRYIT